MMEWTYEDTTVARRVTERVDDWWLIDTATDTAAGTLDGVLDDHFEDHVEAVEQGHVDDHFESVQDLVRGGSGRLVAGDFVAGGRRCPRNQALSRRVQTVVRCHEGAGCLPNWSDH